MLSRRHVRKQKFQLPWQLMLLVYPVYWLIFVMVSIIKHHFVCYHFLFSSFMNLFCSLQVLSPRSYILHWDYFSFFLLILLELTMIVWQFIVHLFSLLGYLTLTDCNYFLVSLGIGYRGFSSWTSSSSDGSACLSQGMTMKYELSTFLLVHHLIVFFISAFSL